jgi:osmoprotectant transport system permease protein
MTDRIRKEGSAATARVDLGSVIAFRALASNGIDAYVDYSGTVWTTIMHRRDSLPRQQMLREMTTQLRKDQGVVLLGALGFENAYALAMRRDRAEELGIRSIADLAQHAPELRIGGDFEFFARSEWQALRDRYGLRFREQRQFQPTFLYKAVASKDVDVISAASSDGRIKAYDLVVLEDPQQVIPPYDAILLLSPARASDPVLRKALQPLVGAIPIDSMRQANYMVDRDSNRVSPSQAARWLEESLHLN